MGNANQTLVKDTEKGNEDAPAQTESEPHKRKLVDFERVRGNKCCNACLETLFVILAIVVVVKSISEIVVTIAAAISTRLFSSEESGRLVGMILLAILAAIVLSILIYAIIAVFKKQEKPLHAAALVLFIVSVLQSVVVGVAVKMTDRDERTLVSSLEESFNLAREENPRHVALWAATQHELNCCGIYGPNDYRNPKLPNFFAPDVPVSCCPSYDPSRSDLVQEMIRETCKSRQTYYAMGCRKPVVETLRTASELVKGLTVSLIICQLILAILACIIHSKTKKKKMEQEENKEPAT